MIFKNFDPSELESSEEGFEIEFDLKMDPGMEDSGLEMIIERPDLPEYLPENNEYEIENIPEFTEKDIDLLSKSESYQEVSELEVVAESEIDRLEPPPGPIPETADLPEYLKVSDYKIENIPDFAEDSSNEQIEPKTFEKDSKLEFTVKLKFGKEEPDIKVISDNPELPDYTLRPEKNDKKGTEYNEEDLVKMLQTKIP